MARRKSREGTEVIESTTDALHRASRHVEKLTTLRAGKLGITPNMLRVILILDTDPGLWSAELVRRLGFEKRSVDYIITGMLKRNLITKATSADDAKVIEYRLTAKGLKVAADGRAIRERIDKAIGKIIDAKSLERVSQVNGK